MKASEFRIRNYVKYKSHDKICPELRGTYRKIEADDILFFDEDEEKANLSVEPIELTK